MLLIKRSKAFKTDLKRYKHNKDVLNELEIVVELLVKEQPIPAKYKNHNLTGKFRIYKNVQELHLRPDDLLVYYKLEHKMIVLVAIGTHAELF